MKTIFTTLIIILFSAAAIAQTEVTKFTLHGKSVSADFLSTDYSTCDQGIETLVSISAGTLVTKDNNGTTKSPLVAVSISVWDNCLNERLLFAEGSSDQFQLKIDPNLKAAFLKATGIPVGDSRTGGTLYVDLDLVWTATSKKDISVVNEKNTTDGVTIISHSKGIIRLANASGTVKVETVNYTPLPSTSAQIQKDGYKEITITHSNNHREENISEEIISGNELILYPNPATNNVTIIFNSESECKYEMTVSDIMGRTLLHNQGAASSGENEISIDLSGFAAGMYFVTLKNAEGIKSIKLLKQ